MSDERKQTTAAEQTLALSVSDTARLLGISRNGAYNLVAEGKLPAVRLGRRLLVPRKSLDNLLAGGWQPPKN